MERKETVKANFSSKCLNSFYCVSVFIFLERYLGHFTIGKDRETSNWAIIAFLFCTIVFFFNLLQYSWFTVLCNNFFFFFNWHHLFPVFGWDIFLAICSSLLDFFTLTCITSLTLFSLEVMEISKPCIF